MPYSQPRTQSEIEMMIDLRGKGQTYKQISAELAGCNIIRTEDAIKKWFSLNKPVIVGKTENSEKAILPNLPPKPSIEPESYCKPQQQYRFELKNKITRVAAFFDEHFPFHINQSGVEGMLEVFRPDLIILGGDNWSLDCISHHDKSMFPNKGFDNVFERFNHEAEEFKKFVGRKIDKNPQAKFVYLVGNHEEWLETFCKDFPQINKPNLQKILGEYASRITFVPLGGFYKVGHLNFCHGDIFGTDNPAKQATNRAKETIVFGHHHTYKVWSDFSMVDDNKKYLGIAVPTMAGRNPKYLKGRPNAWVSGFFTACVKQNGNFSPFVWMMSPKGTVIDPYGNEFD